MSEEQSSSGIIVSTGLGSTGWLKSVIAGAAGIGRYAGAATAPQIPADFSWSSPYLFYTVREPFPSASTGAEIVFGKLERTEKMTVTSCMPENGVIFSDGVESDAIEFNSGATVTVTVAERSGRLVV